MKINQLMDAIEQIDDRFVEEAAYGVRRKSHIPWGLVSAAACFCLVIGAAMLMQSMGILPHLSGTSNPTNHPITTEPSNMTTEPSLTTEPSETTSPVDEITVKKEIKALFNDKSSWYYRALVAEFDTPASLPLRYYFYNSAEFGEGLQPAKEEMDELMVWEDYQEGKTLTILPVSKMDAVLTEVFDITVAKMEDAAFAGMKYVESIDSWCFWASGTLNTSEISVNYIEKSGKNQYILTCYSTYEKYEVLVEDHGDGYRVCYNLLYESREFPDVSLDTSPSVEEYFRDRKQHQNYFIMATFSDPKYMELRPEYLRAMPGDIMVASSLEHEKLSSVMPGYDRHNLFRTTWVRLDGIMQNMFQIRLDQLKTDWESNFVYLSETDCYYGHANEGWGWSVNIDHTEECDDGTILMYYTLDDGSDVQRVATLKPNNRSGYFILANEERTQFELRTKMEELFKAYGWFNQALTCEYDSPEQIGIMTYFYMGLENNKQVSDEEKEQLKNIQGFGAPWGDIYRLPPDKMNAILEECFGITLEDLDPASFNGLAYLESTNCYYFKASAPNGIENFKAYNVEKQSDGTIDVYYNISYMGDYVVTVKPYGDSYRILSNRCILSDPLIPQTPIEPTGDTELEKLFAGYMNVSEKEAAQRMVDAFLADPDTFVKLLAKQTRSRAILGVLSRNVTDHHPQIGAYRDTVSRMLAKELSEEEKTVVYGMAVYSGLSNYLPATPTVADYRWILDVSDFYTYDGETLALLRKFCIEDAAGLIVVLAQERENQTIHISYITSLASQEELEQIKESVTQRKEALSKMTGEGVQEQINCAMDIISSCNERLK